LLRCEIVGRFGSAPCASSSLTNNTRCVAYDRGGEVPGIGGRLGSAPWASRSFNVVKSPDRLAIPNAFLHRSVSHRFGSAPASSKIRTKSTLSVLAAETRTSRPSMGRFGSNPSAWVNVWSSSAVIRRGSASKPFNTVLVASDIALFFVPQANINRIAKVDINWIGVTRAFPCVSGPLQCCYRRLLQATLLLQP